MRSYAGILLALIACRSTLVAGMVNIEVKPSQTNSRISDDYGTNAVMYDLDKLATNPPKILVYLPGTGSKVQGAIKFLESAMSSGYLVVGLAYINKTPMGVYCRKRSMDIECYWDSRRNVIQGVQYKYSGPTVNKENSVVWRLYSMLTWVRDSCASCDPIVRSLITNAIAAEAPYQPPMYGSGIVWENITFSGHSQGAGHVTAIGYLYNVSRVIALSGCTDFPIGPDGNYRWEAARVNQKNTSTNRFYGLVAYNEEAAEIIHDNWKATEFVGNLQEAPVSNGGAASSYAHSHQLCSTLPNNCFFAHGSIGDDTRLWDTWTFMLTENFGTKSEAPQKCVLDPCNKRFEEVMLRLMVGITAVLPVLSTIIFHFCYHRINKNHGRRVCYGSTIASFVVSFGLAFIIFWQYRFKNAWPRVGNTFIFFLLVMFAVTACNVAVLWYYYISRRSEPERLTEIF